MSDHVILTCLSCECSAYGTCLIPFALGQAWPWMLINVN